MLKIISLIVTVLGALAALFCALAYMAGSLPYPDPTPELLQQQQAELAELAKLKWASLAGLAVAFVGALTWLWAWRRAKRPR